MNPNKRKTRDSLFILSILTLFIWIAFRYYSDNLDKKAIEVSYEIVKGRIISYRCVGVMDNKYITYSYFVKNKEYSKKTSIPYNLFAECENNFSLCSDKRFWVAYEKSNPSNSLINLNIEIQNIENPEPPKTLDGFR